jgi:outer membrane biosynthesis protein TonB
MPTGAVVGSLSLHTGLLAFMFWGATQLALPNPPKVYEVELVARTQAAPVREVPVPERRPQPPEPEPEPQRPPKETIPAVTERPQRETPPPDPEPEVEEAADEPEPVIEERAAAPPEQSTLGVEGQPVRLEGAPFPYPEYLANIILQIKRHWRPPTGAQQLRAELSFTIMRDGSVDEVSWVRRSGNWSFDLEARGAIEAAGRRGVFGALPEDYPSDQLRVSFFFDPTRY